MSQNQPKSNNDRPYPPHQQHQQPRYLPDERNSMNSRRVSEGVGRGNQVRNQSHQPDLHQQMQNLQLDHQSPYHSPYLHEEHQYQPLQQPFNPYPMQYSPYTYSPYGETLWRDPRSEHPSPINSSNATFGMWSSPPMSPQMASYQLQGPGPGQTQAQAQAGSRHGSFDEFSQPGYYSRPPSNWSTPTMPSTYGFYPQYAQQQQQPQPQQQQPAVPRPTDQASRPPAPLNRNVWSGPSRPVAEGQPDQSRERKVYHPQAPTGRSDWVMWVGNVPSNTSHEELWRYFNTTIPTINSEHDTGPWRGPSSIFLISRSSCAFVNLSSQADLDRAVGFFNGRPLRPWDQRCPRMVCRVRRKDDDLRSGVGAQRGTGMHREWVKQQPTTLPRQTSDNSVSSANSVPPSPAILEHPPDGEGRRRESIIKEHNVEGADGDGEADGGKNPSSGSFASTNSSFLLKHFPRRIFIIKSSTTRELEESVQTGLWRTQRHNEPILDQAFRTSPEVFLIFGANRSGEFFGYAKMVEPIDKEKAKKTPRSATIENETRPSYFLSPSLSHMASSSPGEITPNDENRLEHALGAQARRTDPADFRPRSHGHAHDKQSIQSAPEYRAQTLDPKALQQGYFPPVPISANNSGEEETDHQAVLGGSNRAAVKDDQGILRKDMLLSPTEKNKREQEEEAQDEFLEDGTGHSFRIEWIKVAPLSFNRTRHLRNPWNSDREVKVSRDGTEVEPNVGVQLMAEWDKLGQAPS